MTANIRSTAVSQADTSADNPLADIYRLVASDFQLVNELIPRRLTSDVAMVEEIGRYIVESGGKRLRPMLVLLSAQALGYKGSGHINLAAIIEFLHTATCCMTTSSTALLYVVVEPRSMIAGATRPAFLSGTFCTPGPSN